MLKSFIRFTEIDSLEECSEVTDNCGVPEYEYSLPAISGDIIKWQMPEDQLDTSLYNISDFKIGIVQCENLIAEDVGTIVEAGDGLLQCTATVPELIEGCYNFVIYNDFTPVEDCSIYKGSTVVDLINDGLLLGDVLQCVPVPDWV